MAPATNFSVIGVDEQRTFAVDSGAGKAGEYEHAGIVWILRRDVLLGDEIHSVPQRRHQSDPRGTIEPCQSRTGVNSIDVADWCP